MTSSGLWTALSVGLLTSEYESATTAAEISKTIVSLAEQAPVLAGAGVMLGLGLGLVVSGGGVYLYKRRQIHNRLEA